MPMDEIHFRIVGVADQHIRNWQAQPQGNSEESVLRRRMSRAWRAASRTTRTLITLTTAAVVVYVVSAQPSVQDLIRRRVVVLLDESGSMANTTKRKDLQLAALKANNISVTEPYTTNGYAISAANPYYSLLQPLQRAVAENPNADTVYVISDFKGGDQSDNDAAGYQQLKDLLRERRLTLYLCTVDQPPPLPEYYTIAGASGGAVIEDFRNKQVGR